MRSFRSLLALALIAVSALSGAASASSTVIPAKVAGQTLKWLTPTRIRIAVSTSLLQPSANIKFDSDVVGALKKSFAAWQDASDVEFQWESSDKGSVSPLGVAGDGVSLITIAPTAENALLFAGEAQNEAAKTRVFYNRAKSAITEADIVLNPYQQFSTDGTFGTFDLQSTLTHEIGHLLGLKHSAVLGSAMSGSFPKNGLFGIAELGPRSLEESDIAAVRELYNAADDDLCCATVSGKLILGARTRATHVWVEDVQTGRVTGLADISADGSFAIGGLPVGSYRTFVQQADEGGSTSVADLGQVTLDMAENKIIGETKPLQRHPGISLGYLGLNNQLADSAVDLTHGQQYTIFLGGNDLDLSSLSVAGAAAAIGVDPTSLAKQDLGNGISFLSLRISIAADAKPGAYSLFINRTDGTSTALIGALRVE